MEDQPLEPESQFTKSILRTSLRTRGTTLKQDKHLIKNLKPKMCRL